MSYGKAFEAMYTGSMFGSPALVYAIWGYVIANMREGKGRELFVELNPALLAATFSTDPESIREGIGILEATDSRSRTKTEGGRRLVLVSAERHAGPLEFRVVNGRKYREMRNEEARREQNREAQRRHRAKNQKDKPSQPTSAQAEAEAEAERSTTGVDEGKGGQVAAHSGPDQKAQQSQATGKGSGGQTPDTIRDPIPCPADLWHRFPEASRSTLEVAMIPEWAQRAICAGYVASYQAKPDERRRLGAWHAGLVKAIQSTWNDPDRRPKKPEDAPDPDDMDRKRKAKERREAAEKKRRAG